MPNPYDRTTFDGKPVDWITRAALEDAEVELGYKLDLTQGSYNPGGVTASAGTHDGGGAVDLLPFDAANKVRVLRKLGFAAWYRPAIPGLWGAHVHAILMGNKKLSAGAKAQVLAYLAGKDGLARGGPDTGPRDFVKNRYSWERGANRIKRVRALTERANLLLSTGIRGFNVAKSRKALREATKNLPK